MANKREKTRTMNRLKLVEFQFNLAAYKIFFSFKYIQESHWTLQIHII